MPELKATSRSRRGLIRKHERLQEADMSSPVELRGRTLALVALNALALGVLAGYLTLPDAHQRLLRLTERPAHTGTPLIGGPFRLTSHTGASFTENDFRGRVMLVAFGHTSEPDLTPAMLQLLSATFDRLGTRSKSLACLFITLDPSRDTPSKLKEYLANFDSRLIGLTGTPEQIAAVAKTYRVPFERVVDPAAQGQVTLAFEPLIYLMNQQGKYVTHLSHRLTIDALIHAIEQVL
jgi:protein SCO1/2